MAIKLLNNPLFNAIKNIASILDPDQRKRSVVMLLLLLVNAIFDVVGLAAIYPLINAALDPQLIQKEWYLRLPYQWIGINDTITFLFILSAIVFFIFLIKNIISIGIFYIQARFSFNIAQRLTLKKYQYYYDQGYLSIANTDGGKKIYDVITIPYYFATGYLIETLLLTTEIVVLMIIFGIVLYSSPKTMFILLLVIVPVFVMVYLMTKNKTKSIGDQRNEEWPVASALLLDSMNAFIDVKLGNKEKHFFDKFKSSIQKINALDALQVGVFSKIHQRLNDVVLGLALMLIFGTAYLFRENSSQIIALLSVFGLAAYRFLPSVNRIMGSTLALKNISYVIDELRPIDGFQIKDYSAIEPIELKDKLAFRNVSYQYPSSDTTVLNNLNIEIKKGETIGIIGQSGSGKTTFLNLFLRLIKESAGALYVDDQIINDENKNAAFQKSIGFVQQTVYIKNGTVIDNVAFGESAEEVDMERLRTALKDAMLLEFVEAHPLKFDMPLGENGVMLSGGQRQRIGIARALYKNAQILLFDEATSALDPETEKAIVTTVKNLTKLDKTIIIVAHRVTTLEMCDRIYELKNGSVAGIYTYKQVHDMVLSKN